MAGAPDAGALAALLRLVAGRSEGAEFAVYLVEGRRMRLAAATGGFASRCGDRRAQGWRQIDGAIEAIMRGGACVSIDPAVLGIAARFCAAQPAPGAAGGPGGFLVVSAGRRRRLTPALVAALADAARIAAPLLAAGAPLRGGAAGSAATLRRAALPGAAADRLVDLLRSRADAAWSLLLLDLDRCDAVSAESGEAAGDALLAVIGARLEACLGPGDRLTRLEGDRFVVLTERPAAAIAGFAADLLAAARQPLAPGGRPVAVEANIGVVAGLAAGTPTRTVLLQAEAALRRAKLEGSGRFRTHAARRPEPREDGRLGRDLAKAPGRGQLRLVYQGYVDLADGRISGAEALLRWRHPTRGELAPAAFIPLAEATGLILPIGAWALHAALEAAARWPPRLALSVNVSAMQFHQPGFVAEIETALAASGVAPERLELEITETVLMRDNSETIAQLNALIAKGVRIALDDFGTGYSALAYLGRLPHHRIKLDRAFVQDLGNPATLDLVRAILALARKTGVAVTAEGVERPDQLRLVQALGFTHAQGFFTGPPVEDPTALLAEPQPL